MEKFTSPNRIQANAPRRKTKRLLTTGFPSSLTICEPLVQVHSNWSTFWKLLKPRMRSTCRNALEIALDSRLRKRSHFSQCMPANCQQSPFYHAGHRLESRLLPRKRYILAKSNLLRRTKATKLYFRENTSELLTIKFILSINDSPKNMALNKCF